MRFISSLCEFALPLSFPCRVFLLRGCPIKTSWTTDSEFKFVRLNSLQGKRLTTTPAQTAFTPLQAVCHGYTLVKDETLSPPKTLLWRDSLKVFQNPAL
jgi:hypothetical protein